MKAVVKTPVQSNAAPIITPAPGSLVKRQCACRKPAGLDGKCEACRQKNLTGHITPLIQPKLKIGRPNDKYEQEADRVAEMVMRMSASSTSVEAGVEETTQKFSIRQLPSKPDQGLQLIHEITEKEDDEEKTLQAQSFPHQPPAAFINIDAQDRAVGGGRPLPQSERNFFEPLFGYDFTQVRIHTDSHTAEIARGIMARAFTVGHDIGFASGEYRPGYSEGRRLLAHELTHVIQQSGSTPAVIQRKVVSAPSPLTLRDPKATTELPSTDSPSVAEGLTLVQSDQALLTFLNGSASQVAAIYPQLGEQLGQSLAKERKMAEESISPLEAKISGGEQQPRRQPGSIDFKPETIIEIETSQKDPSLLKVEPHQNRTSPPKNQRVAVRLPAGDEAKGELQSNFSGVVGNIATRDPGLNVRIENRPTFLAKDKANPNRAKVQTKKGLVHMLAQYQKVNATIWTIPGEELIQHQKVQETIRVRISKQNIDKPVTTEQETMAWYALTSIPDDIRQTVDARLLPADHLTQAHQAVINASQTRNIDKQHAVRGAQQQVAEQNEQANKEQQAIVAASRQNISQVKRDGLKENQALLTNFERETRRKEQQVTGTVQKQIATVRHQVDQVLTQAEQDVANEKADSERKAAAKQQELAQKGSNQSWWERTASAIKQAVEVVIGFIANIFTKLRQKVKHILDGAKSIAVGLIEQGQKRVIDKLDGFGNWLKAKANHFVGRRFPQVAQAISKHISTAIEGTLQVINRRAEDLKRRVAAMAATLGQAMDKILSVYQAGLKTAVSLVSTLLTDSFSEVSRIVFETALSLIGAAAGPFMDILNRAGESIKNIIDDPVGFLKNLLAALGQGFSRFSNNIVTHLKAGFMGWLFGTMAKAGIQMPEKFDLEGIFDLVLQTLGITTAKIETKVIKMIGPENVERIQQAWSVVSTFIRDGLSGLWEEAKVFLGDLESLVVEEIKSWVITKIVTQAVIKLASLFNPVGAIIQAVQTIYNVIMFVIERMGQIAPLVEAVTNSLGAIANGHIEGAAIWIEKSLARLVPVAISFLARLLGLGGIASKIQNIIRRVQIRVDEAIDKVLNKIARGIKGVVGKVQAGTKKIAKRGQEKITQLVAWWKAKKEFKSKAGVTHTLFFSGKDRQAKLMIASRKQYYTAFIKPYTNIRGRNYNRSDHDIALKALDIAKDIDTKQSAPTSTSEEKRGKAEDIQKKLNKLAEYTSKLAEARKDYPPSVVDYGDLGKDGRGTWMNAETLSRSHPEGYEPRDTPVIWQKHVGRRRAKGERQSTFVRGHLLNNLLGGPGRAYNLTPITRTANTQHEKKVENPIWQIVVNNGVVRYYIQPDYTGDHANRTSIKQQLQKEKTASSSQKSKDEIDEKMALLDYEENNLATSLVSSWHELEYNENSKKWIDKPNGEWGEDYIPNELPDDEFDIVERK